MRKIDRLFVIVQLLRGRRLRTAAFIANELDVSIRTVYRDIQGLMASGVPIEGERGVGYFIRQPIELPPLKFTTLELKAIQLGIQMVQAAADEEISRAAREASVKILDVLPCPTPKKIEPVAHVYFESGPRVKEHLGLIRDALSNRIKIHLVYDSENLQSTERVVWPLGLEFWGKVWTFVAWCELRQSFRMFRIDRISKCVLTQHVFENESGKTYKDYLEIMKNRHD